MSNADFPFYRRGRSSYDDSLRPNSYVKHKKPDAEEKFALGRRGILVFFTLAVLTLMAALDGTSLSVALPVRTLCKDYSGNKLMQSRILRKN
jgi:hypothetical protein